MTTQLIDRIRELSSPMEPQPTGLSERLQPLPNIRALLFDIYGTLFMSGTGDISLARAMSNKQALTEALRFAGFSGDVEQAGAAGTEYLLQAIQDSHNVMREQGVASPEVDIRQEWTAVLLRLQAEQSLQGEISPDAITKLSVDYECRVNPIWPMPDLQDTLQQIRAQNCLLGIVSNAQFYTQLLFPAFLNASYEELGFEPQLCAWSFEYLEAKPSVRLFQGIVERFQQAHGITPDKTLYVGNDMLNDIWPAARLGLKTALFAGDRRSLRLREDDERCKQLEPDLIITKLSQLLKAIEH